MSEPVFLPPKMSSDTDFSWRGVAAMQGYVGSYYRGLGNVARGFGHFAWDLGAVPFDVGATLLDSRLKPQSYSGESIERALESGIGLGEIYKGMAPDALSFGTWGYRKAILHYAATGDATEWQEHSGSFLANMLLLKGMEIARAGRSVSDRGGNAPDTIQEVQAANEAHNAANYARFVRELAAQEASENPTRSLNDPLPRHPNAPHKANPYAPDPAATGPHTVIGTRSDPRQSPAPYRTGITYDEDGYPVGKIDVTTHGRGDHSNPHYHRFDPTIKNPFDPMRPGNFGPQGPMPY